MTNGCCILSLCPTEAQFPKNFKQLVSKIFTRLFRVGGMIRLYHKHPDLFSTRGSLLVLM